MEIYITKDVILSWIIPQKTIFGLLNDIWITILNIFCKIFGHNLPFFDQFLTNFFSVFSDFSVF